MSRKLYADNSRIEFGQEISNNENKAAEFTPTKAEREQALREATLDSIGIPDDLIKVDVKQLHSPNFYRVNVYREVKRKVSITDSFYIKINEDEVISSPPMKKTYYDGDLEAITQSKLD